MFAYMQSSYILECYPWSEEMCGVEKGKEQNLPGLLK